MQELEKILEEIDKRIEHVQKAFMNNENMPGYLLYKKTMEEAKDIIRSHMNNEWIPVEERLPEEGQNVWISVKTDCVRMGMYTKCFGFGMRKGFICSDGFMCIGNVLAWKPFVYPEPYRPERS